MVSAEAVEDASDTAKSLEGVEVFWIQETCELGRVQREWAKVRGSMVEGARIWRSCLRMSIAVNVRRGRRDIVQEAIVELGCIGVRVCVRGDGQTGGIRFGAADGR